MRSSVKVKASPVVHSSAPKCTIAVMTRRRSVSAGRAGASSSSSSSAPDDVRSQKIARRLILLRHAESLSPSNVRDHERPISDLGRKQSQELAALLRAKGWVPDLLLASNAKRTKQTLEEMEGVIEELKDVDTHLFGSLYTINALDGQTRQHIEELVLGVADDQLNHTIAIIGHNKGMEEAASSLAGAAVNLRTASAALLQCMASSWADVLGDHQSDLERTSMEEWGDGGRGGTWELVEVLTPASASSSS